MSTIYIVTTGDYSDYGIRAVFSTRELAEAFARRWPDLGGFENGPEIGEYELDPATPPPLPDGVLRWNVTFDSDGNLVRSHKDSESPDDRGESFSFDARNSWFVVYATDLDKARAIAIDRRRAVELAGFPRVVSVMDAQTCGWCQSRHGTVHSVPISECQSEGGCRCVTEPGSGHPHHTR